MSLFRIEADVITGQRKMIAQIAYRLGESVVVLDAGESPPEGYEEFDPASLKEGIEPL